MEKKLEIIADEKYSCTDNDNLEYGKMQYYKKQRFIAGTNYILSSKGLVEREAVMEILRERIANFELAKADFTINYSIGLLNDLINKIKQL